MSVVPEAPKTSEYLTNWLFTYTRLRFFTRMRRFLQLKAASKKQAEKPMGVCDFEKQSSCNVEVNNWVVDLQKAVKMIHFGRWEEKEVAVEEIRMLVEGDLKRRRIMAELGVIPPLVDMVGSEVVEHQRLAVRALIEIANGSFTNKALMVEAGILLKLPQNTTDLDETTKLEFSQLILSISTLAISQFSLTPARMISLTHSILESTSKSLTEDYCLTTLHNLSSVLDNVGPIIATGAIDTLLKLSSSKDTSEKSLAILGNLVVTLGGRKVIEHNAMVPQGLIEIMTWDEQPKCQELSAYILMNLAHQSPLQREKMAKAGIVQVLLEVALLGSPLAQKRALKILQWFKDERQVRIGPHSGPQVGRVVIGSPVSQKDVNDGRKLMKRIVKQSLRKNMETIILRSNGAEDDSSTLQALVNSSSSKSLPY